MRKFLDGEPVRNFEFSSVALGIALVAVWLGDLNPIARCSRCSSLPPYLVLNVAAGVEGFLQSPSFRPSLRVHWGLSLLGATGRLGVMFLINAVATAVAAVVVLGIYLWLERRELQATWSAVRSGVWMALVRAGIFHMDSTPAAKTWRPNLLVLSGAPTQRWNLIDLAHSLTHDRGLVTVSTVLPAGATDAVRRQKMERLIGEYLNKIGVQALVKTVAAADPFEGAERLVHASGLGSLVPNMVLLGDSKEPDARDRFAGVIEHCYRARRNVGILRHHPERSFGGRSVIDVWWGGLQGNGGLMLILAYLLRTSASWRGARIRVKLMVPSEAAAERARANLKRIVGGLRIGAEPEVLAEPDRPFVEVLRESSADTDLVLLGLATPDQEFARYYERVQHRSEGLPSTLFVLAAQGVDFGEVLL